MRNSIQTLARIGGALYLSIIALGLFGELLVRGRIVVADDAMATAANLRSMEGLWRVGIAAEYLLLLCVVPLTLILFVLLRRVNRDVAWLAIFFNLLAHAVEMVAALDLQAALLPLGSAEYLGAFAPEQLAVLARLSVRAHGYGFSAALLLFGCACLVYGFLIFRSGFLPRILGVLMAIAGASYLTHSFVLVLSPPLAAMLFPTILLPAFVGELSLTLWLLTRGVNGERWARAEAPRPA